MLVTSVGVMSSSSKRKLEAPPAPSCQVFELRIGEGTEKVADAALGAIAGQATPEGRQ